MINFNLFVLPFSLGLLYLILKIGKDWYKWITTLSPVDKVKFTSGIRNPIQILISLKEVFFEVLIHRKMWKRNPLLGYMHMSFALGWFLLIILGNIESRFYSGTHLNAPYYPIFLKFFIHDKLVIFFEVYAVPRFFRFIMDLLLLYILSGLLLAFLKRKKSRWFGMKRVTRYQLTDHVALTTLWLIFPMRLLAESFTAGYYGSGGGFMTQPLGNFLAWIVPLPTDLVAYTMWWGYSLVLGIFFVTLPYSRYMHIPTEVLLIFFRNFGIKPKKWYSGFSDTEVHSCSRCGVCLDICQMNLAGIHDSQAVYFIRDVRDKYVSEQISRKCLVCGRCQEVCPVGIHSDSLRLIKRRELSSGQDADYSFVSVSTGRTAEVVYFSGCMSHLTPSIIRSMKGIMEVAGVSYLHLDENRSICCGRPLMLAGKDRQAHDLVEFNKKLIRNARAGILVTSCPICYRVFKEEYNLPIRIQHHAQFLLELVRSGKIPLQSMHRRIIYHDPCDLGRGSHVYEAPRELLGEFSDLLISKEEKNNALCCGGSLGMFEADQQQRDLMTNGALDSLLTLGPELLATSCPLCKKTFGKMNRVPVKDLAELVFESIPDGRIRSVSGSVSAPFHPELSSEAESI
ncbi:MAG: (Fe-S)-binding protein [Alphaproteobacteria bacterium]|nr:(Fe-S)-binding protein [Alphaproteobacteria bacterium]